MATPTDTREPRKTIYFWRTGSEPFDGEFYIKGARFEDFLLVSSTGRIPQDACDAVKTARVWLESGAPDAYARAVAALKAVGGNIVAPQYPWT